MDIILSSDNIDGQACDVVATGFFVDERPLRGASGWLDWRLNGRLSRLIQAKRLTGEWKETILVPSEGRIAAPLILLIGLGRVREYSLFRLKELSVHLIDDELSMREQLDYMLKREGYLVDCAENGRKAAALVGQNSYDLLLCDIRLGDMSGLDVLRTTKQQHPDTVVIMVSAYASTEVAVEAMNEGAYDYVPKPFNKDELMETVAKALKLRTIEQEKVLLDGELKRSLNFGMIVGNSPAMQHIYKMIRQVSKTKTNVLITGESGTGKELIARAIHSS